MNLKSDLSEKIIKIDVGAILFFALISIFLLKGVLFTDGILLGGDWSLPGTKVQSFVYCGDWNDAWTSVSNLFGNRQVALTSDLFKLCVFLFSKIGIIGNIFQILLLVVLFSLSGYFLFDLILYFKIKRSVAFLSGVVYITSPLFFDYMIMGWQFVLVVMVLFPVTIKYFLRSVQERRASFSILVGIFYSVAVAQAQSIVWFPMLFFVLSFYLVREKKSFFAYIKSIGIIFGIFFLLSVYWLPGMLLIPDKGVSGSDIVNSTISLGTMTHFYPVNMIRLFGGLFNFQYETEMQKTWLGVLSFVLPFLALGSLFVKKLKKEVLIFWLIGLVPFVMFLVNFHRNILLHIPFSNVIRDFARFTVFSTFAYAVLAGIFLDYLFSHEKVQMRKFGVVCIVAWMVSIFPWWTGALTDWEGGIGSDMRLRTKIFSDEYYEVETDFYNKKLDQKASFFPYNGMNDLEDDERFHGAFKEIQDIFAGYSSVSGVITTSDRGQGYLGDFLSLINDKEVNIFELAKVSNLKYFVLRTNMFMQNKQDFLDEAKGRVEGGEFGKYFKKDKLVVFNKKDFLPHFYTPLKNIVSGGEIDELIEIVSVDDYELRSSVFFKYQNEDIEDELQKLKNLAAGDQVVEFRKINPTKYRLRIHDVKGDFPLVFSESFHDQWRAYVVKSDGNSGIGKEYLSEYRILDGNENDQASAEEVKEFLKKGWLTDLGDGKEKQSKHYKWNGKKEVVDYIEKYSIDFVSKNFNGTIQNDNLPKGRIWETWGNQNDLIQISDESHLMVNGYANAWMIDAEELCGDMEMCQRNDDGSYDMEVVVEFWPQRLFYVGLAISGATLLGCLGYLGYDYRKRRINKK